jgi:hypothetical protein
MLNRFNQGGLDNATVKEFCWFVEEKKKKKPQFSSSPFFFFFLSFHRTFTNATSGGSYDQIEYLVTLGMIEAFNVALDRADERVVDVILDGLENVLKVLFPFSFFFFCCSLLLLLMGK